MPFNPIETSLYVTLKSLTQDQSILSQLTTHDISARKLDSYFNQNNSFLQQNILSFTAPPSQLNPYQQIIYKFSKRLEHQYLTAPIKTTQIVFDTLAMDSASDTMVGLRQEQLSFMTSIDAFIDYCHHNLVDQAPYHIQQWKQKNKLISLIFEDSKPSITGEEFSEIIDMAHQADDIKNHFKRVKSIYVLR